MTRERQAPWTCCYYCVFQPGDNKRARRPRTWPRTGLNRTIDLHLHRLVEHDRDLPMEPGDGHYDLSELTSSQLKQLAPYGALLSLLTPDQRRLLVNEYLLLFIQLGCRNA